MTETSANPAAHPAADTDPSRASREERAAAATGVSHAVAAYLLWGLATPLYFRWLREVSPWELLTWRVLSGLPLLLLLLIARRDLRSIGRAIADRGTRRRLLLSTALIGVNWYVFILAVVTARLSEASLGYFINPIVSVALGVFVLGERLRRLQAVAVAIAAAGVGALAWEQGSVPWIALVLAGTFGLYGLLRKRMAAGPATGLAIEMIALLPAMLALQIGLHARGTARFLGDPEITLALAVGGVVTTAPLVLFASGARRLRLATVGLLQYIAPTGQLALAVLAFGEPFGRMRGIAFALIAVAVAVYTADSLRAARRGPAAAST
jgi:chloramphenicol-sensitive protein RarD